MAPRNRFISVSELRTWCYCHKAWHFEHFGYPSSLSRERVAGMKYHQFRDQTLRAARRTRIITVAVMLICVVGIIVMAMRSLSQP